MSLIDSLQKIVIELATWTLLSQLLDMSLPHWASVLVLVSAVWWRFGRPKFRTIFSFKYFFSLPVLLLVSSAIYSESYHSLLVSPQQVLLIPLKEEIFYRFIIPKIIEKRFKSALFGSTLISSALFGFAHRNMFPFFSGDMGVCLLAAGALGFRTSSRNKGSISESLVIHVLHNMHAFSSTAAGNSEFKTPAIFYLTMLAWDVYRNKRQSMGQ
jgi:membrane protease YdiL (CAAX protease family)